jgi:hypothetical protein
MLYYSMVEYIEQSPKKIARGDKKRARGDKKERLGVTKNGSGGKKMARGGAKGLAQILKTASMKGCPMCLLR